MFLMVIIRNPNFVFVPERNVRAFLLWLYWTPQLSRDIPVDAGFVCDKAAVLGAALKWRPRIMKFKYGKF